MALHTAAHSLDLVPMMSAIAARPLPPTDSPVTAARLLNEGIGMTVLSYEPLDIVMPNVDVVVDPDHEPSADHDHDAARSYNCVVIVYRGDPVGTAARIEAHMHGGDRVVLVDQRYPGHGDPALIDALMNTTAYIGNLAAYDTDVTRALAVAMTPLRDGIAFRRYLAHALLYYWAWLAVVRGELTHRFGDTLPADMQARATTHTRTRIGASLLRLGKRGLRFTLADIRFTSSHVDSLKITLAKPLH
jgi:hypothetical protein